MNFSAHYKINQMKFIRLIILTALSMVTMQSFAQTPIASLRNMFTSGSVSIEAEYELMVSDAPVCGETTLMVQGDRYHVRGNGLDIYNDGKTVWTVDENAREVIIEQAAYVQQDYMGNPVLLLAKMDEFFKVQSQQSVGSRYVYVMDSIADCGISQVTLTLSPDGRIVSGKFSLDDGNVFSVKVSSMKKTEEKPASSFSPQIKFGSDWIVTDLR